MTFLGGSLDLWYLTFWISWVSAEMGDRLRVYHLRKIVFWCFTLLLLNFVIGKSIIERVLFYYIVSIYYKRYCYMIFIVSV